MNGQGSIVKVKNEMSDVTQSFQTLAAATILNITFSAKQSEKSAMPWEGLALLYGNV